MTPEANISNLPLGILAQISTFLVIDDFNALAKTCKAMHKTTPIKVAQIKIEKVDQGSGHCDISYAVVDLEECKNKVGSDYKLQLVRFSAKTKDQGFAIGDSYCSWIEAAYKDKSIQSDLSAATNPTPKSILIRNYEVRNY